MGLLVTLYLISYNVYGSLKAPKNRGFSYIELWMIGHQNVIFIAILEYGLVLIWKKFYYNWLASKGNFYFTLLIDFFIKKFMSM